jgi:hypothetical protein
MHPKLEEIAKLLITIEQIGDDLWHSATNDESFKADDMARLLPVGQLVHLANMLLRAPDPLR